jgi:DNA-binding MarR family transcriptional regulator
MSDLVPITPARSTREACPRLRRPPPGTPPDVDGRAADALSIDRPNATVIVADLESQGLVRRRPHPTDGRAKVVEATPEGIDMARRADAILATPPPTLSALGAKDLETLRRILRTVA